MILVDTSVWIRVFSRSQPLDLVSLVDFDDVVTCLPVIQEVLQGFREDRHVEIARTALRAMPCLGEPMGNRAFEGAAELYRAARRRGLTVRSSVDVLIASLAIDAGATVLHIDRDFEALATVSGLRERRVVA